MWICLNNAFLSIVDAPQQPTLLLVRARVAGHLEAAFPGCRVTRTPDRDYLFRTLLPREVVANVLSASVLSISYGNFKNSVKNDDLHEAYSSMWTVMNRLQSRLRGAIAAVRSAPAKKAAAKKAPAKRAPSNRTLFGGAP